MLQRDSFPCSPALMGRAGRARQAWRVAALLAGIVIPSTGWSQEGCFSAPVAGEAGQTRHALVVGVGRYASASVDRLPGPANDAQRIYDLLTGPNGYEFPAANVCKLVDEGATVAAFRVALRELARRATAGDVAVIFVAGHGSQVADLDGDEASDGLDETLLLHDSRTPGVGDLVDDEIQELLAAVQRKTPHVTAIFDSCNSGSVQRGDALARFQPPSGVAPVPAPPRTPPDRAVDGVVGELPGLVVFSAASDGTSALEVDGKGIFTDALLTVLSPVGRQPLTYAQVARQVPHLIAARSYQIPYFNGDLDKVVFGVSSRRRPVSLEVKSLTPVITLVGPPIPGIGVGAEMRVYDGAAGGSETGDPGQAKATLVVNSSDGVNTTARVVSHPPGAAAVKAGDLAVLVRPGDAFLKLRVRLRPAAEPQGLSAEVASGIRSAVQENEESRMSVETTAEPADLELSAGAPGEVDLRESGGVLLSSFTGDCTGKLVAEALWQLARQRAVLQLRGEGGTEFVDGETLRVEMVPADEQTECAAGPWIQAGVGSDQIVPLCHRWRVRVTLSASSPRPLLIGGLALSSDGSMFGFPRAGVQKLDPGKSCDFTPKFEGGFPLERPEYLLVFGTQETNPVPWHLLTATAKERGPGEGGSLYRALHRYFQPGARGTSVVFEEVEDTTWTMSSMRYRVRTPDAFGSRLLDKDKTCDPKASCGRLPVARLEAGRAGDELGHYVAQDGEILYAGVPGDDERGRRAGSVQVFRRADGRWSNIRTLRAGETGAEDAFGTAVAADAETVLVGSPYADSPGHSAASAVVVAEPGIAPWSRQAPVGRAGVVYVFRRDHDEWTETACLVADPPVAGTRFGDVVALEGPVAAIAASAWGRYPPAPGAVWIFERTGATWKPAARLQGTPPVASAAFGSAVAIRGGVVAVGAPGTGGGSGAVHLFERGAGGWPEVSRLVDPDPEPGERFGASLALVDDLLLVGGPHDGEAPSLPGLVRIFRKHGPAWDLVATLRASTEHDGFGRSLAGLGSAAVVGGWGRAHLFSRRGDRWSRIALFTDEENRYSFGRTVALTDSAVLVGGGVEGDRHGAVFAFELPDPGGLPAGAP